jgi:hypothetical protein
MISIAAFLSFLAIPFGLSLVALLGPDSEGDNVGIPVRITSASNPHRRN